MIGFEFSRPPLATSGAHGRAPQRVERVKIRLSGGAPASGLAPSDVQQLNRDHDERLLGGLALGFLAEVEGAPDLGDLAAVTCSDCHTGGVGP